MRNISPLGPDISSSQALAKEGSRCDATSERAAIRSVSSLVFLIAYRGLRELFIGTRQTCVAISTPMSGEEHKYSKGSVLRHYPAGSCGVSILRRRPGIAVRRFFFRAWLHDLRRNGISTYLCDYARKLVSMANRSPNAISGGDRTVTLIALPV